MTDSGSLREGEEERVEKRPTCELCGYEYDTDEEAEACVDGHIMAEEEMGIFDGDGSNA